MSSHRKDAVVVSDYAPQLIDSTSKLIAGQVGGSLSGLMNAIMLRNLGFAVHVLERSAPEALESQAAGINAGPEVHAFIETYIPHYPANYAIALDSVKFMDREGNITKSMTPNNPLRLTTRKAVYRMLRDALLVTRDAMPPATYQTKQQVHRVQQEGDKMIVSFQDLKINSNKTIKADIVIAADGAHSILRNLVLPGIIPEYAGYVTWRGRVPETALSEVTREALKNQTVFLHVDGGYAIS